MNRPISSMPLAGSSCLDWQPKSTHSSRTPSRRRSGMSRAWRLCDPSGVDPGATLRPGGFACAHPPANLCYPFGCNPDAPARSGKSFRVWQVVPGLASRSGSGKSFRVWQVVPGLASRVEISVSPTRPEQLSYLQSSRHRPSLNVPGRLLPSPIGARATQGGLADTCTNLAGDSSRGRKASPVARLRGRVTRHRRWRVTLCTWRPTPRCAPPFSFSQSSLSVGRVARTSRRISLPPATVQPYARK
jgi:hypothetical protein